MAFRIEQKESEGKGMFFVEQDKEIVGHLTYSLMDNGIMTIDHTEVAPRMNGKGLASSLVRHSVEFAKKNSYKVDPMCSYAAKQFERHGEYRDIQVNQL